MESFPVEVIENPTLSIVKQKIKERQPILIRNWDVGPCVSKWSFEYVAGRTENEPVKVHVTTTGRMDFITKNFVYKTLPLNELLHRVSRVHQKEFFIQSTELYYLRSIGKDRRGKIVADFTYQFPELAADLNIPPFFEEKDIFSTVFRASSRGIQLWTHYDVMDNLLIQVRGVKRVLLWPPSEIDNMYMIGDKSEITDVDNPNPLIFPKFMKAKRYITTMGPGDMLYIPALWFHNTLALEASLAVNTFWKNLSHDLYDKNDVYGNKDLLPVTKGMDAIEKTIKILNELPPEYKAFYIRRMINKLEASLVGFEHCA